MATITNCIYCSATFDADRGDGDHILPVQLGSFRNDVRFRGACPKCNGVVGRSEQQLLQCGPEAFLRAIVRPAVPGYRLRAEPSLSVGAMGAPAPVSKLDHGDHFSRVRPLRGDPRNVEPINHLVLVDRVKGNVFVPLFPGMTPAKLKERIDAKQCKALEDVRLHSDDDGHWEKMRELVLAVFPGKRIIELPPVEPGTHRVKGRVTFTVNEHYFRALAKIAFHYYLSSNKHGLRGDEPEFEPIRKFIMAGTDQDVDNFVLSNRVVVQPIPGASRWLHALAAVEVDHQIFVQIQTFVGPQFAGRPVLIRLAFRETSQPAAWGHWFIYDEVQSKTGHAGEVVDAPIGTQ